VVVASGRDWPSIAVAEQWLIGIVASLLTVDQEVVHECRRDRLPSHCSAFFVEEDEALLGVEVGGSEV
jgi:hypothetical protein